jgi:RNA polymerase primary sigma factor
VAELSEKTGLDPHKVEAFTNLVPEPLSLDAPAGFEGDARLGDFVADGGDGPAEQALGSDLAEHVHALLETLPERERMILRRRFGLDGRGPRTLQEIGEAAGVSRERIRQLEVEALRKLRRLAPKVLREIVK